jgi:hypothetical protein
MEKLVNLHKIKGTADKSKTRRSRQKGKAANQDQMGLLSKEEEKEKMTRVRNEMGAVTLQNLLQAYE